MKAKTIDNSPYGFGTCIYDNEDYPMGYCVEDLPDKERADKYTNIFNSELSSHVAKETAPLQAEIDRLKKEVEGLKQNDAIEKMQDAIINNLSDLENGYGRRKWAISEQTGISNDILTVLLKRLKLAGKIELIMVWSESTGMPNGSGYCLTGNLNPTYPTGNPSHNQSKK